jgi:hypothetical protein
MPPVFPDGFKVVIRVWASEAKDPNHCIGNSDSRNGTRYERILDGVG